MLLRAPQPVTLPKMPVMTTVTAKARVTGKGRERAKGRARARTTPLLNFSRKLRRLSKLAETTSRAALVVFSRASDSATSLEAALLEVRVAST